MFHCSNKRKTSPIQLTGMSSGVRLDFRKTTRRVTSLHAVEGAEAEYLGRPYSILCTSGLDRDNGVNALSTSIGLLLAILHFSS